MSENAQRFSLLSFKNIVFLLSAIIAVIAVGASMYFYIQYYQTQQLLKNPNLVMQQQTNALITSVGKLMELPKGEQPTIATVSDASKLKDQLFFQNAQNGDKVLIYTKARKAILFRPNENKIIDVAPVNLGTTVISPTPSMTQSPTGKAALTQKPTPTVQ